MSGMRELTERGFGTITIEGAVTASQGDAGPEAWLVTEDPQDASTNDVHVPAANTAAIVSYPATPTVYHVIGGVAWSYDDDPTGGRLTIVMNGSTVLDLDITTGGPGFIPFDPPKRFGVGDAVSVTLAAGGVGIQGKVSVLSHWTE